MRKTITGITAAAATAVLIAAMIAGSAHPSRAQDSQASAWDAPSSGAALAQPDKPAPPPDIAGCWSGTIQDAGSGPGTGAIFFVQHKNKLVKGTGAVLSILSSPGPLKGKVTSTSFVASDHGKHCKTVAFTGQPSGPDLTGTYILRRCLGVTSSGTFDFAFDSSGNSCGGK